MIIACKCADILSSLLEMTHLSVIYIGKIRRVCWLSLACQRKPP
jgi:hypothetical protein